jgi:hypothetical protein
MTIQTTNAVALHKVSPSSQDHQRNRLHTKATTRQAAPYIPRVYERLPQEASSHFPVLGFGYSITRFEIQFLEHKTHGGVLLEHYSGRHIVLKILKVIVFLFGGRIGGCKRLRSGSKDEATVLRSTVPRVYIRSLESQFCTINPFPKSNVTVLEHNTIPSETMRVHKLQQGRAQCGKESIAERMLVFVHSRHVATGHRMDDLLQIRLPCWTTTRSDTRDGGQACYQRIPFRGEGYLQTFGWDLLKRYFLPTVSNRLEMFCDMLISRRRRFGGRHGRSSIDLLPWRGCIEVRFSCEGAVCLTIAGGVIFLA